MKKIKVLPCLLGALLIGGCNNGTTEDIFNNPGDNLGGGQEGSTPTSVYDDSNEETIKDIDNDLSELKENITLVDYSTLSNSSTSITSAGNYLLQGEYTSMIEISVGNNETTHLFLDNVAITNSNGIAISNTNKKSNLIITVIGTNSITNSGDDVNAIHVKGNLSINGSGTLNVTSNSKNGIKVSKVLNITGATLNVTSANHAISARTIVAQDSTINVLNAEKDGLNAECDDETTEFTFEEGYVSLENVNYTSNVKGDAIQADTFVYVNGGNYNLTTNGTFVSKTSANMTNYDLTSDDFKYIYQNSKYVRVASDSMSNQTRYALVQSSKGIKVGEIEYTNEQDEEVTVTSGNYYILIENGTFNINTSDDALHTNSGSLTIEGGTFTINTLDDALTSDKLSLINNGTITVESCYEGIEGAQVEVKGGTVKITSSDDGINAASDDTSLTKYIIISGGNVEINASGDGIDSNGSLLISGENTKVIVNGPTSGGDAGLDSETGTIINGGTVYASSTLGMVETPSTNSSQYVLSFAQSTNITSGTIISILDSDDNTIFTTTATKNCQSIIISLPSFEKGKTYKIYGGSTLLSSFTISNTITSIGTNNSSSNPQARPDPRRR